jgi:hypothetical protein
MTNKKGKSKGKSRFPAGMTERKAKTEADLSTAAQKRVSG